MQTPGATAIVFWITVSSVCGGAAERDSFDHQLEISEQLHRKGAYIEAERRLLALLAETDGAGAADTRKPAVLNNLGSVYHSMSRYSQAEQCYRRAIELEKAAGAAASEFRFQSTVNLACLYLDMGEYPKADRLGLDSLLESRPMARRQEASFARLLSTLGALEFSKGRLGGAERFYLESLKVYEGLGPKGVDVIEVLSNMGILYMEMGRPAQARRSYERALGIACEALPADDPSQIRLLMNAGTFYAIENERAKAESLYRRALALAQEKLGDEHPVLGSILGSYAVLLEGTGRKAQAALYKRRAETILSALEKADPRSYTVDARDLPRGK